jgi:hypothetical protein
MNEIMNPKQENSYVDRYRVDPYGAFASEGVGAGIVGKLLACRKGEWGIGPTPSEARRRRRDSRLALLGQLRRSDRSVAGDRHRCQARRARPLA